MGRWFLQRWVVATFIGWIAGVVVILILSAVAEAFHLNGALAIGTGMGLSVGVAQWLCARRRFDVSTEWIWASLVGIGAPWVVSAASGRIHGDLSILTVAALCGPGAFIAALWQQHMLPSTVRWWWILGSIAGWSAAAMLPIVLVKGGHPRSFLELLRNVGGIAGGGIVLGVITSLALMPALGAESARRE